MKTYRARGERRAAVVNAMRDMPCITIASIAESSGLKSHEVAYVLDNLQHIGVVEVVGHLSRSAGARRRPKLWRLKKVVAA